MADTEAARAVDEHALAHVLRRMQRAPQPPWLHGEAARRMADRLRIIKRPPRRVLDWWASVGGGAAALAAACPQARISAIERVAAGGPPGAWWSPRRWSSRAAPVIAEAEVGAGTADLVWANMMLHAVRNPQAQMLVWQQALAVDGFLMFSTLGPGTLEALAALYRVLGWPVPFAPFVDMHDLGDMLVHAGFADPVMDQETVTLTWADADALLAELRGLGGNVDPSRHAGLRTPRWRDRLRDALAELAGADGRPALAFELVYGHAFKAAPRHPLMSETTVPLDDMRAMVRSGRRRA
jgi:malonyl-CoA O-methyltransferase